MTATGPIDGRALGPTLIHEHIYSLYLEYRADYGWNEEAAVDEAAAVLNDLSTTGITTLVDMTVLGMGRSAHRLRTIAERVPDLNLIAATGVFTFGDLPNFFRVRMNLVDENWMADFFTAEITDGIGESGVRAGVIKFVTDRQGVNDDVRTIATQVARAQLATGVPIITHSHSATQQGLVQQDLFSDLGVDLGRVVIGHAGDSADLDYLQRLIDRGSWIAMDRFGHGYSAPFDQRIETVVALCERGYAARMVLSHDANVVSDSVPPEIADAPEIADWTYRCIPDIVLPRLRERGVSERDIELMMVANPRAILEFLP